LIVPIRLERLDAGAMIFIGPSTVLVLHEAVLRAAWGTEICPFITSTMIAALRCAVQRSIGSGSEVEGLAAM
jgi:hypothetical protein